LAEELPLEQDWPKNYFNYFTEVEEHFRNARGSGMFLLSPLDWALVEAWKNSGVPLEAVLRGIDAAFQKWRSRKQRSQAVNSLAYCAQAISKEAEILANAGTSRSSAPAAAPFEMQDLQAFLAGNAEHLRSHKLQAFSVIAQSLEELAGQTETHFQNLEDLERRLSALEEKMIAIAKASQSEDQLLNARRDLDRQLQPYRSKMTTEQLAMLEKQFLDRRLLEDNGLRRLSLFYLAT
jgi:hypothetical protein